MRKETLTQLPNSLFKELGWDYFVSPEAGDYLPHEVAIISEAEQEAFYQAANHLYERLVDAAEYVLRTNSLDALGIPRNLHQLIRYSWEDDRQLHIYGRFDFAGGTGGLPIKLMEFNADTPTSLPETAIIQWGQLAANGIEEERQFNFVYEALVDQFRRLIDLHPELEPAMLFSTLRDAPEDEHNLQLLEMAAREAGFETAFRYIDEVIFSEYTGIFASDQRGGTIQYPFWFKLIPWEFIAFDEPQLADLLTKIVTRGLGVVLNPAYTLLFQSKGILKFLWDRNPKDPLLLETSFEEPFGRDDYPFVEKVFFGREGSNVSIYDEEGLPVTSRGGEYENQPRVYQALAQLDRDEQGQYYQAGVFFAYEACGLGFRRSPGKIIDNGAQFVGHVVE